MSHLVGFCACADSGIASVSQERFATYAPLLCGFVERADSGVDGAAAGQAAPVFIGLQVDAGGVVGAAIVLAPAGAEFEISEVLKACAADAFGV